MLGAARIAAAAPDAMPAGAPAVTPDAGAATGSAAAPPAAPTKPFDPKDPSTFTDDALLGKAARVNGNEQHGLVAFTFDDGPNPETTPAIIDALEKYDIPATFFIITQRIVGKHGDKSRDVLARELADGFLVGSHSVTHTHLGKATGKLLDKEIDGSIKTLATETNRPIGLFRPPYGALSGAGRVRLKKLGVTEVIWSIDTLDWQAHHADRLRKKVLRMIVKDNGGIVLMHDVKPITASIIADVLDDLEAENCQRLKDQKDPILPVSIHYFLRDGKTPRAIPEDVRKRTEAYSKALPARCKNRPAPAAATPAVPVTVPAKDTHPIADFPTRGETPAPKPKGVTASKKCQDNPLAAGCM
jgi:peptidoglycan/xylan/chitin deacetylase (PgdA/CDA1 family)